MRKRTVEKYFLVLLICQLADWLSRQNPIDILEDNIFSTGFGLNCNQTANRWPNISPIITYCYCFFKRISCIALVTIVKMMSTKLGLFYGWCMFTVPTYILHTFSMVTLCIYVIYKMIHHRSDNFSLYIYLPISTHSICK